MVMVCGEVSGPNVRGLTASLMMGLDINWQILLARSVEGLAIDEACSTARDVHAKFWSGNLTGRDFLEGLGVSRRIILKLYRKEIRLERARGIYWASNMKQAPSSCGLGSETGGGGVP
jgi:hypothetical protein